MRKGLSGVQHRRNVRSERISRFRHLMFKDIWGRMEKNSYKITKIRMLIDFQVNLCYTEIEFPCCVVFRRKVYEYLA